MVTVLDTVREVKARPRHPEKARLPDIPVMPKPSRIRVKAPGAHAFDATRKTLRAHRLHTVCEEAACPNIGEAPRSDDFTKSGIMVGLGESDDEIERVMDDLRSADVGFLTIGQYLQPTRKHAAIDRFVTPEGFQSYRRIVGDKGFLPVAASPLTRSPYHAAQDFAALKAAREAAVGA